MRFVIITGMSGAGKSQVAKFLEDLGYFCIDNLPPALIPKFADICFQSGGKMSRTALVIDIRGGELLNDLFPALNSLKDAGLSYEILFLEASDEVLIKRYKETRRSHPLSVEGRLINGISEERKILENIKAKSNHIIDTSNLTPRKLKEEITGIFIEGREFEGMIISIISFGFKYGIPNDSDLVFDVRFMPNPFYLDSMKKLTGKNETVKDFVLKNPQTREFIVKLTEMLEFLIPNYIKEGKSQLVIGIGCTGGKHRSVVISDTLHKILEEKKHRVVIEHRDIGKDNRSAGK
jgi:RNase adapter protein RapZ